MVRIDGTEPVGHVRQDREPRVVRFVPEGIAEQGGVVLHLRGGALGILPHIVAGEDDLHARLLAVIQRREGLVERADR